MSRPRQLLLACWRCGGGFLWVDEVWGFGGDHAEVGEEGVHHEMVLADAVRERLFAPGGFEDHGLRPEMNGGGAGEAAIGGRAEAGEFSLRIVNGGVDGR